MTPHRFIVVEGPIGVGKTTLARRLQASLGGRLLLEGAEENPFLPRFYADPRGYALSTQLHFLLQRADQFRSLRQGDLFDPLCVADFMLDKDRIFAGLNLEGDELELYHRIYRHLSMEAPRPDLVVYLQAPVEVLLERVRRRAIPYEQAMDPAYLERLGEAYTRYFHDYAEAPLLIVNAAACNFADGDEDYNLLLDLLRRPVRGRQYLNPGAVS